jgi:hypothetical protein
MSLPLKLGAIEQQHLQELYEAAGVPRDELPYTPELARVCRDFQDRTFKNANEAQVYGALLKYVRSGRRSPAPGSKKQPAPAGRLEQAKQLSARRPWAAKVEPYTAAFNSARDAFARDGGGELSSHEFWHVVRLAGASRGRAPAAAKV